MKRARKSDPRVRCCWVCGKVGGEGATTALAWAGYLVPPGEVAHAHPGCLERLRRRQSAPAENASEADR